MLLTQVVGLLHGVVHARGPLSAVHEGAAKLPDHSVLEALFAHHDDAADCQVFDQLSHADALGFAPLDRVAEHHALPRLRARPLPQVAAQTSSYLARGPPAPA